MKKILWQVIKLLIALPITLIVASIFLITTICGAILTLIGFEISDNNDSPMLSFLRWYEREFIDNHTIGIIFALLTIGLAIYLRIME